MMEPMPLLESEIIATALGGPHEAPVDLNQVARYIGVSAVRHTPFVDGFTDFQMTGPVIYLGQTESRARTRFIYAHELAHVMIRAPEVRELMERRGLISLLKDEERLANSVASSLLIPDSWVEEIRTMNLAAIALEKIAAWARVSVMVLITRLAAAGLDIAMLHWQRGLYSWHVVDRPGVPLGLHGEIQPSGDGIRAIENLGQSESKLIIEGHVSGRHVKIAGRGRRNGGHALQYIEPSRDIWPRKIIAS